MRFLRRGVRAGTASYALAFGLFFIGLSIRAALYFPLAMFQIDSDAVIAGLCGLHVLHGQHPIFLPGGLRVGAASCYVAAGYFHLLGTGRVGLALTGLTWGALYLLFTLLFLQATFERRIAIVAYLFAIIPSEQFMTVTYAPWGYGEIMASCAATLWLASEWRRRTATWPRFSIGLSIGIGVWFSFQTLMIAIPALAWVALKRRSTFVRESLVALPGIALGAAPFLIGNVTTGFPSLTHNSYSRPVSDLPQALSNLGWLLANLLPKLFLRFPAWPDWAILLGAFVCVTLAFAAALRRGAGRSGRANDPNDFAVLFVFVVETCVLIFSFSAAGTIRGWTVRYIAPLYVVVPAFYGIGIATLWSRSKALAAATVAALLIPNLLSYGLPGSELRRELTTQLADDRKLRQILDQHHVRVVYGNYLWVYHLNFDSGERIAGVPFQASYDYYHYGDRLGAAPIRWSLLGSSDEVATWSRASGARGPEWKYGGLTLRIAGEPTPNAARVLLLLRANR